MALRIVFASVVLDTGEYAVVSNGASKSGESTRAAWAVASRCVDKRL